MKLFIFKVWPNQKSLMQQMENFHFSIVCPFQKSLDTKMYMNQMDNNHCTTQKHQISAGIITGVTVATHLKVRRMESCAKIPSGARIHLLPSCFSSCVNLHLNTHVYYDTLKQQTYFNKEGKI